MEMPEFHRRVLDAAFDACNNHKLVLAGGYAMRAHGLVDRPSEDLDFATITSTSLDDITDAVAAAYRTAGFEVEKVRGTPLLARLVVTDSITGQSCAVDLMKKPLQRPPVVMDVYHVASLDDLVGMKVAALHGRSVPRDAVDLSAVADLFGFAELERLGSVFDDEFSLETLRFQLDAGIAFDDAVFEGYGLTSEEILRLRRFLVTWSEDLSMRLAEEAHLSPGF
jgi:predicted nucleotidyltransferase component of viral defense system